MTDATADPEGKTAKSGKKPFILAVVLAMVGGGAGFYAVSAGLLPIGKESGSNLGEHETATTDAHAAKGGHAGVQSRAVAPLPLADIAFVEVDPVTISLISSTAVKHLRFRAQLEVNADYERDVVAILPRVTDVMNSYLRALELSDLTDPLALVRLRAQLLRRVQIVTGKGRVRDLLVMEFVLN